MDCPFCNKPLKKIPGRKTKCPNCSEFIFVRTDPKTKERVFVNEKRAHEIDEEWSTTISSYEIVKYLHDVGIDEKAFIEKKKALFELYKTPILDSNVATIMLSGLSVIAYNQSDYQLLKRIYFAWALIECKENRPFFHLLVEVKKYELLIIYNEQSKYGGDEVKIFIPAGECENCLELDGKVFKTLEIINNPPIPNPNCTYKKEEYGSSHGWCVCMFQSVIDTQKFKKFFDEKYPLPSNVKFEIKDLGMTIKTKSSK